MNRHLLALAATALLGLGACSGDTSDAASEATSSTIAGSPTAAQLSVRAAELTDLMASNDWAAVRRDFDPVMEAELSEDRLASTWQTLTTQVGAFTGRGEPVEVPKDQLHVVFDTPMTFERAEMKSRVAFNRDGSIAGLFLLEPTVA